MTFIIISSAHITTVTHDRTAAVSLPNKMLKNSPFEQVLIDYIVHSTTYL